MHCPGPPGRTKSHVVKTSVPSVGAANLADSTPISALAPAATPRDATYTERAQLRSQSLPRDGRRPAVRRLRRSVPRCVGAAARGWTTLPYTGRNRVSLLAPFRRPIWHIRRPCNTESWPETTISTPAFMRCSARSTLPMWRHSSGNSGRSVTNSDSIRSANWWSVHTCAKAA